MSVPQDSAHYRRLPGVIPGTGANCAFDVIRPVFAGRRRLRLSAFRLPCLDCTLERGDESVVPVFVCSDAAFRCGEHGDLWLHDMNPSYWPIVVSALGCVS